MILSLVGWNYKIANLETAGFTIGQCIDVKVLGKNDQGRLRLSRRAVLLRDQGKEESGDIGEKMKIKVAVKAIRS